MARIAASEVNPPPHTTTNRWIRRLFSTGQAYLYLMPMLLILAIFNYFPAIFVFYISFFKWNFLIHGPQPLAGADGLDNYRFLFHDPNFWQSARTTLEFVLITVPLNVGIALFLALLLMSGIRGRAFWRLAIFTPYITPLVATVTIWYWMFDRYHGLFNNVLSIFHVSPVLWLDDPRFVLPSIILYTVWKSVGFNVVLFMAGLANADPALGEAARVDGANVWQQFRFITWPTLAPITIVVILLSTIDAFKMFQPAFLFAGAEGGPNNAARTLGLYLFDQAFLTNAHDGLGAAIAVCIFLIVFTISAIQLGIAGRRSGS